MVITVGTVQRKSRRKSWEQREQEAKEDLPSNAQIISSQELNYNSQSGWSEV
jgi:hypothetical protein